jgi:hypothetical protein
VENTKEKKRLSFEKKVGIGFEKGEKFLLLLFWTGHLSSAVWKGSSIRSTNRVQSQLAPSSFYPLS